MIVEKHAVGLEKTHEVLNKSDFEIKLTKTDKELLQKLDMEHQKKVKTGIEKTKLSKESEDLSKEKARQHVVEQKPPVLETAPKVTAVPNPKSKQKVCSNFTDFRRYEEKVRGKNG